MRAHEDVQWAGVDRIRSPRQMPTVGPPTNEHVVARDPAAHICPQSVLRLQRTAGNAATAALVANHRRVAVQRDGLKGTDPLIDLAHPTARGLLYGISEARKTTSDRLKNQDATLGNTAYRTIDDYNAKVGIYAVMNGLSGAHGIFKVRDALNSPVASWANHLPGADPNLQNDADLLAWINILKLNVQNIGLYDVGRGVGADPGHAAAARISEKNRFTKNILSKGYAKKTTLTPIFLAHWLGADRTYDQAFTEFSLMTYADRFDLGKWVFSAFFRRTSKLGIDFTTGRQQTIHFNTSGDAKFDADNPAAAKMRTGDLRKDSASKQTYGRIITASEYKHLKKGLAAGTINPAYVNIYDEWKKPPKS